jgi:general secretion pathway protein K
MQRRACTCAGSSPLAGRGVALIVVLLILAVIAAIVFEFCYDSRVQLQLAENTRNAYQALHCAEAGLAIAVAALEQNHSLWADEKLAVMLSGAEQVPIGPGYCTVSVAGERGRINVNGLVTPNGKPVRGRIDQMLRLIDVLNSQRKDSDPICYGLVPAIIDWIDPDDEITVLPFAQGKNTGAESDYYLGLAEPYRCRNAPIDVVSELLLIRGMTREILYGSSGADRAGRAAGMGQFLTVYGDGRVNINNASAIVVQTLSEHIDPALAESILRHRPYRDLEELGRVPGMTPQAFQAISKLATIQPGDEHYTVTSRGVVGRSVRTIRLIVHKDRARGYVTPLIRWEM